MMNNPYGSSGSFGSYNTGSSNTGSVFDFINQMMQQGYGNSQLQQQQTTPGFPGSTGTTTQQPTHPTATQPQPKPVGMPTKTNPQDYSPQFTNPDMLNQMWEDQIKQSGGPGSPWTYLMSVLAGLQDLRSTTDRVGDHDQGYNDSYSGGINQ